jgi:AraC family transcriptional regulator
MKEGSGKQDRSSGCEGADLQTLCRPGKSIHSASWLKGAVNFERRDWRCAEAERHSSDVASHRLVLVERGVSRRTEVRINQRLVYRGCDWPGALSIIPASIDRRCTYRGVDLTYCALRISPTLGGSQFNDDRPRALTPFTNIGDPVICGLVATLGRDLSMGYVPGAAYIEHMALLVLHRVGDLRVRADSVADRKPLPPRTVASVDEYIRAHLEQDISVAALATCCAMRTDTFARRFRAATGTPPYAYITALRIERAQRLLRTTNIDLTTLALSLGFSSHSHFTTVFRRAVGVAPARYRMHVHPTS